MGQARAIMVAERRDKHLRFMLETPKLLGMEDTVTVALKGPSAPATAPRDARELRQHFWQRAAISVAPRLAPANAARRRGGYIRAQAVAIQP